jgi:hypothetical protein
MYSASPTRRLAIKARRTESLSENGQPRATVAGALAADRAVVDEAIARVAADVGCAGDAARGDAGGRVAVAGFRRVAANTTPS